MKKASDRMQRIFIMARTEERRTRQDMGRAQLLLDAEKSRLSELQSYRQNYEKSSPLGLSARPSHWADYQNFLCRLSSAVSEQQKHVLVGKEHCDLHRKHWIAKRQRLDALQKVVDRYRKTETQQAEQKLQKALDDRPRARSVFKP